MTIYLSLQRALLRRPQPASQRAGHDPAIQSSPQGDRARRNGAQNEAIADCDVSDACMHAMPEEHWDTKVAAWSSPVADRFRNESHSSPPGHRTAAPDVTEPRVVDDVRPCRIRQHRRHQVAAAGFSIHGVRLEVGDNVHGIVGVQLGDDAVQRSRLARPVATAPARCPGRGRWDGTSRSAA